MARKFEILGVETLHKGFLNIVKYRLRHERFDGTWSEAMDREVMERGHCVGVLPYDPIADKILLIEQFRIAAARAGMSPWQMEIVAGIIDTEETPVEVAHRESLEEAGCSLSALEPVGRYLTSAGATTETIMLYCGRIDSGGLGGLHGLAHEHEDIRAALYDAAEVPGLLASGKAENSAILVALQWLLLNRARLREKWR